MTKILIIDDDESTRETLRMYLAEVGYSTFAAANGAEGLDLWKRESPDLIVSDVNLPDANGLEIMARMKESDPNMPVIIITAFDDMKSTIAAMQKGAYDYLEKPIDINRLKISIQRALENRLMSERLAAFLPDEIADHELNDTLIGKSTGMREIYKKIGQTTNTRVTVLVQGESGTGKELIAKIIHYSGVTKNQPFVAVNCSALTETLLESELFGHVRGAFTDAIRDKKGKFELAGEGTVFLDEISEMSESLQVKLLRVLQELEFERVGGETSIPVRARIIAATNRNLEELVRTGRFREDLYYRLSVFTIHIPPLRERKDDVEALVVHLLNKINLKIHRSVRKIGDGVMDMLKNHDWRGNVRELENALTQAVVLSRGDVLEKETIILRSNDGAFKNQLEVGIWTLEEVEKSYIKIILDKMDWNIARSCVSLGISKPTIYRKIQAYGLKRDA
ncbi:MAG: sigma-54 dependent transcriptional regulator [Ignavibacteriales bacterium]|nr:sigma-54 dependent transcriptional regulator [Ignavibacteriales bacterium]